MENKDRHRALFRISYIILLLAALSAFAAASAGVGTRLGFWDFRTGFAILRFAAYGGLTAALFSIIMFLTALALRGPASILAVSVLAFIIGGAVIYVPASRWRESHRVPAIHDITTDTENPPQLKAVLPLRKNAQNPSEYGGPDIAKKQQAAYPDIKPLILPLDKDSAFEKALRSARALGWEIVEANKGEGRIEATDKTFWFGFKDDIVVRITPLGIGSAKIDVRSVSRVGRSDIGTNAKRIRRYLALLEK
ncbi:MAG: DUF1499 domain-containing protein [Deltaproteobacteria bacterium]|nr:DUF1499 domain-containing protein [Deltaproteobacteria bacterium]